MTLSSLKIHLAFALLLAASQTSAAPPPTAEMAAAEQAVAAAQRAQPQGEAAEVLRRAGQQLGAAQAALDKRKYRDAQSLAETAQALADLARTRAERDTARADVDSKAARNADLRRRQMMSGGEG